MNAPFLAETLAAVDDARLLSQRTGLAEVCCSCCRYLEDGSLLRVVHALETLSVLMQARAPVTGQNRLNTQ